MSTTTKDMRGFTLVHVDIDIPTGTARVERTTDLPLIAGQLPPKKLLKDGRKAVLDPAVLQPLYNNRKQVQRALADLGTPFFGGSLVPNDAVPMLASQITAIESDFVATRDTIAPALPTHYADWEAKHPEWAALFRQNRMTSSEFITACRFRVAMLTMAEPLTQEASTLFTKAADAIIPGFLEDIAKAATKAWETHAKGRGKITQHGLAAVRGLIGRLAAFSLLDARIAPSCASYQMVLEPMPKAGPLNPRETATLQGVLQQLMDPARILAHGEASFAAPAAQAGADVAADPDADLTVDDVATTATESAASAVLAPSAASLCGTSAQGESTPEDVAPEPIEPTPPPSPTPTAAPAWATCF